MGMSVDTITGRSNLAPRDALSDGAILFMILSVSAALTNVISELGAKITANFLSLKATGWLFDRLLAKGARYFDSHPANQALNQLSALTVLESFYSRFCARVLNVVILMIAALTAMFFISPWVIAAAATFALASMGVDLVTRDAIQRALFRVMQTANEWRSLALDTVSQLPACARYGVLERVKVRLRGKTKIRLMAELHQSRLDAFRGAASTVVKTFDQLLFVCIASYFMSRGDYGLGTFVAAGAFKDQLANAMTAIFQLWREHELLIPQRLSLAELEETRDDISHEVAPIPDAADGIVIANVSFSYGRYEPNVLRDVHVQIRPGEFVVLCGPSGSGKTTLMRLICGELVPSSGLIAVDKHAPHVGTRGIGTVLQTDRLLTDTIRNNIKFFRTGITDEQIMQVLEFVGMDDVVDGMPLRLNTPVSETVGGLSGGQRQRLLLARAMLGSPKLVLLDEATSSLDVAREAAILSRLRRTGVTVLVCSHRPEVWTHADRLLEIVGGAVVERRAKSTNSRVAG